MGVLVDIGDVFMKTPGGEYYTVKDIDSKADRVIMEKKVGDVVTEVEGSYDKFLTEFVQDKYALMNPGRIRVNTK